MCVCVWVGVGRVRDAIVGFILWLLCRGGFEVVDDKKMCPDVLSYTTPDGESGRSYHMTFFLSSCTRGIIMSRTSSLYLRLLGNNHHDSRDGC